MSKEQVRVRDAQNPSVELTRRRWCGMSRSKRTS